jgi:phytoene dehydrogenase-like protein
LRAGHGRLAAARALELAGVQGAALLDTQAAMGGNSQGGQVKGIACPLGAHYLPVPGDDAHEVQDWLEELGVRQRLAAAGATTSAIFATARRSACTGRAAGMRDCCPCRA